MIQLQQFLEAMSESDSQTRANYHLTLGGLRDALEKADPNALVLFDDGTPAGGFDSYRGYYVDIAIDDAENAATVAEWRSEVQSALKKTFVGYKGGDYPATPEKLLWRSEYGCSSGVAVVGTSTGIEKRFLLNTKQVD